MMSPEMVATGEQDGVRPVSSASPTASDKGGCTFSLNEEVCVQNLDEALELSSLGDDASKMGSHQPLRELKQAGEGVYGLSAIPALETASDAPVGGKSQNMSGLRAN